MLFCNICGQCTHINEDCFLEYADISGTETRYLDPVTGEVTEYGDTDTETSGDSSIECPYCSSTSIDMEWDGVESEAVNLRSVYDTNREIQRKQRDKAFELSRLKDCEWDMNSN